MARHDATVGDAKRARRLDIFKLAQLECLGAQQAAQACPSGQAEDHAKQEQAQISTLGRGGKQARIRVDVHLHHQHAGGDQEHAGD